MLKNKVITRINESKTMVKHISCDCKCKFNGTRCNSNQKWNNEYVNVSVKIIVCAKIITVGILAHVFARMVSI